MEEKMKVYVVCVEEDGRSGIISEAWPFRTKEEAWKRAEEENVRFKEEYGYDLETKIEDEDSIYSFTDDYYVYITVTEHEI